MLHERLLSEMERDLPPLADTESLEYKLDVPRSRFPFSIVWTTLPLISWLFPFVGHLGICRSDGVTHDFAGPYYISVDNFAFGVPQRYWRLSLEQVQNLQGCFNAADAWDKAIKDSVSEYQRQMYSFCCNNCHNFVATCLNKMNFQGRSDWGVVSLVWHVWIHGHFVSFGRAVHALYGFFVVVTGIVLLCVFLR
eukprot:gnl/Hemi2/8519_TR2958_c0_g1_i1.p1 gnl/Hemi2/8519_TR2958_c0_g1~~gnl/Hemi2/8519_TR2958_c0_g1_i1.p1  ORF type:complete len:202 (+),score=6.45 gnl/Hemi2/8519_TR2958_c0_g1_i1:25-606(+)